MNQTEFNKYLRRDHGRCYHCGIQDDTLIPQHRRGRGMGGSKSKSSNGAANIITFCSAANQLLEQDADFRFEAKRFGWSLESWQSPDFEPVFDVSTSRWWILENDGSRHPAIVE